MTDLLDAAQLRLNFVHPAKQDVGKIGETVSFVENQGPAAGQFVEKVVIKTA